MPKSVNSRGTGPTHPARRAPAAKPALALPGAAPLFEVAQQLRRWADNVLGIAGSAGELSLNLAKARSSEPRQLKAIEKAGSMLRQAREAAGMTTRELSKAIEIADPKALEQAEIGKAALPMEVILRLASVLGRHDPVPFAMKLARTYNPQLWKALDALGIGSLVALAGRERELANLYRANDDARRLSDADFAEVLAFVKTGFDMTVKFRTGAVAERTTRRAKPAAS
jgi:transcriptional regulator with XRE-family HTH domain